MSEFLDLEQIDALSLVSETGAVNIEAANELASMVTNVSEAHDTYYNTLARQWEANILFYQGDQYLVQNVDNGRWSRIPRNRYLDSVPRRVNNQISPIVDSTVALFTKTKPNCDVEPNSNDPVDKNAAALAGVIQDAKWEIDDEQQQLIKALYLGEFCGTAFRKDYWDETKGPMVNVNGVEQRAGDNVVQMLDPFRMRWDIYDESWFIESSLKPLWWVKNFDIQKPGFTGLSKTVKSNDRLTTLIDIQESLRTHVGQNTNPKRDTSGKVRIDECYIQPTKNHPKGIMMVLANGVPLFVNDSPYWDESSKNPYWHPYTIYRWKNLYFRAHGLEGITGMIPYQRAINATENLIALNIATNASPMWKIPINCGVEADHIPAVPGGTIKYNPVGSQSVGPDRVPGISLPSEVFNFLNIQKADLQAFTGLNDVLRGIQPSGVNTASQLAMLQEQSFSRFGPDMQNLEDFIEKGQQKKLLLIQHFYKEVRPDLVSQLKSLNRDNLDVEIKAFIGSDLRDNVNVRIETGSTLPRLKSMEQALYKELAGGGMLGPIDPMSNPIGNSEFLKELGVKKFTTQSNVDVEKANWVNGVLKTMNDDALSGAPQTLEYPRLQLWELNPQTILIHEKVLTDFMKRPNFKDEAGAFNTRYQEIQQAKMAVMPPPIPPVPMPPQGNGEAQELTPQGQNSPPVQASEPVQNLPMQAQA